MAALGVVALVALAGCSGSSVTRGQGYGAKEVAHLWWWLFWVSLAVWLIVMALATVALVRRRRADVEPQGGDALGFVATAGIFLPLLVLIVVYVVSIRTQSALSNFPVGKPSVRVEVVGHQWWWEVHYPDTGTVTANEVHIPTGTPVRVDLRTADVIHSFWVPQLAPKMDLVSGKVNTLWLRADEPGRYPGRCAEYCGLQHATMDFMVVAQPVTEYQAWLKSAGTAAPAPATDEQRRGLLVLQSNTCAACHSVAGTTAAGRVGPDLTGIGSRWTIGAGALPNNPDNLRAWITNPQRSKPGNAMPPQPLDEADLRALVSYLESLH